jgi:hypothetical protein
MNLKKPKLKHPLGKRKNSMVQKLEGAVVDF